MLKAKERRECEKTEGKVGKRKGGWVEGKKKEKGSRKEGRGKRKGRWVEGKKKVKESSIIIKHRFEEISKVYNRWKALENVFNTGQMFH